jgi:hypothetical protein
MLGRAMPRRAIRATRSIIYGVVADWVLYVVNGVNVNTRFSLQLFVNDSEGVAV